MLFSDFEDDPAKVLRLVIDNWEHPAKKEKVDRLYRLDIKYQRCRARALASLTQTRDTVQGSAQPRG